MTSARSAIRRDDVLKPREYLGTVVMSVALHGGWNRRMRAAGVPARAPVFYRFGKFSVFSKGRKL